MPEKPSSSPWGKIQRCKTEHPGVFQVSTAGHGGIMVSEKAAAELLSTAAVNCGFNERGYICFEEDCQASVVIKEMLDKNLWKIPEHFNDGKEKYTEMINNSVIRWNPEYWEAIGNELPFVALENRLIERLNSNMHDYENWLMKQPKEFIFGESCRTAAYNDAFGYLTKTHLFNESELSYLLQFRNPLDVVADCWPALGSEEKAGVLWEIADRQAAFHSGEYALMSDKPEIKAEAERNPAKKPSILADIEQKQKEVKPPTPGTAVKKGKTEIGD